MIDRRGSGLCKESVEGSLAKDLNKRTTQRSYMNY